MTSTICKEGKLCPTQDTCKSLHSVKTLCKYADKCTNKKCVFNHEKALCKYGDKCTNKKCLFTHDKSDDKKDTTTSTIYSNVTAFIGSFGKKENQGPTFDLLTQKLLTDLMKHWSGAIIVGHLKICACNSNQCTGAPWHYETVYKMYSILYYPDEFSSQLDEDCKDTEPKLCNLGGACTNMKCKYWHPHQVMTIIKKYNALKKAVKE